MQSRQLLQHGNPFIATNRDDCNINAYRMVETKLYRADPQIQVQTERPFEIVTWFYAPAGG